MITKKGNIYMKKWLAFALALVMLFSLCGCPKTDDPKATDNSTESTANNATDPTTSTDPTNNNGDENTDKEEKVTVSLLNKVVFKDIYDDEYTTTEKVPEYDENYNLIGVKTYRDGVLYSETTYDKDPSRPLVEQLVEQDFTEDGIEYRKEYTYDKNGNELTYTEYDDEGEILWQSTKTYDKDGNLLTEVDPYREKHYTYDASGNKLSRDDFYEGEWECKWLYTYTEDGKPESSIYNSNDSWSVSTYDYYGNILEITQGFGDELTGDETTTYYHNVYDNDTLVEVNVYQDDVLIGHRQYDSAGNETLYITYYVDGTEQSRDEHAYDENGKLIRSFSSYADGDLMIWEFETIFTYNDNGDLIDISGYYYDELDSQSTLTYETITVPKEQAEKIEMAASLISMI
jgi:YD repeat-containing protein